MTINGDFCEMVGFEIQGKSKNLFLEIRGFGKIWKNFERCLRKMRGYFREILKNFENNRG